MSETFLKAEWRKLAMANYAVDKTILDKYVPDQTDLDLWNNTCYISLVGFMFLNTNVMGLKIPFHTNFEEVNLRFYVKYHDPLSGEAVKRGVVFIKEIVPKPILTWVANAFYQEHYETMPMAHAWAIKDDCLTVEYKWKKDRWNSLKISAEKNALDIEKGSVEEFITEHYWGYKNEGWQDFGIWRGASSLASLPYQGLSGGC